jgi:hypothetical protein
MEEKEEENDMKLANEKGEETRRRGRTTNRTSQGSTLRSERKCVRGQRRRCLTRMTD